MDMGWDVWYEIKCWRCLCYGFQLQALKNNIFFDVDIVVKKKSKCGFSWSVLLPTTSRCHYLFPKHYGVCVMSGYEELLRDDKFATLTSSFLKFLPLVNKIRTKHFLWSNLFLRVTSKFIRCKFSFNEKRHSSEVLTVAWFFSTNHNCRGAWRKASSGFW